MIIGLALSAMGIVIGTQSTITCRLDDGRTVPCGFDTAIPSSPTRAVVAYALDYDWRRRRLTIRCKRSSSRTCHVRLDDPLGERRRRIAAGKSLLVADVDPSAWVCIGDHEVKSRCRRGLPVFTPPAAALPRPA